MPKVPEYGSQRVQQAGLPDVRSGVRATPADFGGQVGQSLTQLGNVMQQRAVKLQEEENQTAALESYNNFHREIIDAQYSSEDAFHKKQGRDAYDGIKDQTRKLDEIRKRYAENLKTKRSRDLFGESSRKLVDRELTTMSRKGLEGLRTWQSQTYDAGIVRAFESAAVQNNDSAAIGVEIDNVTSFVAKQAELKGWGTDVTAVMLEKQISALHKGVILSRMQTDPVGAKDYFESDNVALTSADRLAIDKVLKPKVTLAKAQGIADTAKLKFDTMTEATTWIRKNYSGDEEKQAVSDVKIRFSEEDAVRTRADREAIRSASSKINSGRGMNSLDDDELRVVMEKDMLDKLRKRAEGIATGKPFNSAPEMKHKLYTMQREDPAAFAEVDLYDKEHASALSEDDQTRFWNLQNGIDKASAARSRSEEKALTSANKLSRAITLNKALLRSSGLNPNAKGGEAAKRFGRFSSVLLEQLETLKEPATEKQLQEIVWALVAQGEETGSGLFEEDDIVAFEAIQHGVPFNMSDFVQENSAMIRTIADRAQVHETDTAVIVQALITRGVPVTAKNVREAYDNAIRRQ